MEALECTSDDCTEYSVNPILSYPLDVWQHVQLDIDLAADRYDVFWAKAGAPLERLASEVGFRGGPQDTLQRFAVVSFTNGPWGTGDLYLDNVSAIVLLPGDFNENGSFDAADLDDLTRQSASRGNPSRYDLTGDALVNNADVNHWATKLLKTWIGDANLDGEFNSGDLVQVLAAGTYEADIASVWSTGDFNGDGRTNSSDLVAALADGGYEVGPRPAVANVPEPCGAVLIVAGILVSVVGRRSR
jgi:hypothetical protein